MTRYRAEQHPSGWWEVTDGQRSIDDSGDGGFLKENAEMIAAALNGTGTVLRDWSDDYTPESISHHEQGEEK